MQNSDKEYAQYFGKSLVETILEVDPEIRVPQQLKAEPLDVAFGILLDETFELSKEEIESL